MDPLTHTATGLFLSRAGLKRWTPLATPILLLAANAPDIDIVTLAGGPLNYLNYHRHLTHALAAMPLMAFLPVVLVRAVARKPVHWMGAFAVAMIAVASHLLLDLTNAYGVRLLLPFSARWLRLDLMNIVDLWVWAIFLLSVAGPFVARLVGSEISSGTVKTRHHGRGFAIFALAFLLLYNGWRLVLHDRAVAILDSRIYQGLTPSRVAAMPDGAVPWRWHGIVETGEFFAFEDVNLMGPFDPTEARIVHKPEPDPAIDAARRTPVFQQFLEFAQYPLWRVFPSSQVENAKVVEVMDVRFGAPFVRNFIATAVVNAKLQVIETSFQFVSSVPR
jgi:inner membrane protein